MDRFERYAESRPEGERDFYRVQRRGWSARQLREAHVLAERLQAAGCAEPEGWVFSEVGEGMAQSARWALIKALWERAIEPAARDGFWLDGPARAAFDKVEAVLSPDEKRTLLRAMAQALAFEFAQTLDEGFFSDDLPGWAVMEADAEGRGTGRQLAGLHESILDPEFRDREA